jgi:hypothetical protein
MEAAYVKKLNLFFWGHLISFTFVIVPGAGNQQVLPMLQLFSRNLKIYNGFQEQNL